MWASVAGFFRPAHRVGGFDSHWTIRVTAVLVLSLVMFTFTVSVLFIVALKFFAAFGLQ
jgi:hypothetical protein